MNADEQKEHEWVVSTVSTEHGEVPHADMLVRNMHYHFNPEGDYMTLTVTKREDSLSENDECITGFWIWLEDYNTLPYEDRKGTVIDNVWDLGDDVLFAIKSGWRLPDSLIPKWVLHGTC